MTLGCAAASAHAASFFEIEAGIGGSAYKDGGDGWWVQQGFEHRLDLTAPAVEVGVTGDLYEGANWGVEWHIDYAWLGTIHTQSMAVPLDSNYNVKTKRCNGPCMALADYMGAGHDQGFLFTIDPYVEHAGWRFAAGGGAYVHRATWSMDVTNYTWDTAAPTVNLHLEHQPKWQLGAVVEASVAYKRFSVAYQYFMNGWSQSDPVPPIWRGTHMLIAKYKW